MGRACCCTRILSNATSLTYSPGYHLFEFSATGSVVWTEQTPASPSDRLSHKIAREGRWGPDGSIFAGTDGGSNTDYHAGATCHKYLRDRSALDWANPLGPAVSVYDATTGVAASGVSSVTVHADGRSVFCGYNRDPALGYHDAWVASFDASGSLEWTKYADDTDMADPSVSSSKLSTITFGQPFCVRALSDGSTWVIKRDRLVRLSASGSVLVSVSTPPLRYDASNSTLNNLSKNFEWGSGAVHPTSDVLGILLHETPGTIPPSFLVNGYSRHAFVFINPDGSDAGGSLLLAGSLMRPPSAMTPNSGSSLLQNAHCVTATQTNWLLAYPRFAIASPSGVDVIHASDYGLAVIAIKQKLYCSESRGATDQIAVWYRNSSAANSITTGYSDPYSGTSLDTRCKSCDTLSTPGAACTGYCDYKAGSAGSPIVSTLGGSPGTYTVTLPTSGTTTVEIGGAGGGGGASESGASDPGQGGGSGEYRTVTFTGTAGDVITITIGAPGDGGSATNPWDGQDGGNTTASSAMSAFSSMQANGGKGGAGDTTSGATGAGGSGGSGGIGTNGSAGSPFSGTTGGNGANAPGSPPLGGSGGTGGTSGHNGNDAGNGVASAFGCGGGGAGKHADGGKGGTGWARITSPGVYTWVFDSSGCSAPCSSCATVDAAFYLAHGYPATSTDVLSVPCS